MSRHSSQLQVCSLAHLWRDRDAGKGLPAQAPQLHGCQQSTWGRQSRALVCWEVWDPS